MALCLSEQQKNRQLEDKRKREDPQSLEMSVAQQRASLAEAQVRQGRGGKEGGNFFSFF